MRSATRRKVRFVFDQFRVGKRDKAAPASAQGTLLSPPNFPGGHDPVAEACTVIIEAAGSASWPLGKDDQRRVVRKARARTHPDLHDGDRTEWNRVEVAARTLRLA